MDQDRQAYTKNQDARTGNNDIIFTIDVQKNIPVTNYILLTE